MAKDASHDLGDAKLVIDGDKITIKTMHMPTARQLFEFHHKAVKAGHDNTQLHTTNDGWAFLYVHLKGAAPDRPPRPTPEPARLAATRSCRPGRSGKVSTSGTVLE